LREAGALDVGDDPKSLDQRQVGIHVAALEPRTVDPEVARGDVFLAPVTADQSAGENAVGGDADALVAAGGQNGVLGMGGFLSMICDGPHRVGRVARVQ
jgi:hypothetical protein